MNLKSRRECWFFSPFLLGLRMKVSKLLDHPQSLSSIFAHPLPRFFWRFSSNMLFLSRVFQFQRFLLHTRALAAHALDGPLYALPAPCGRPCANEA